MFKKREKKSGTVFSQEKEDIDQNNLTDKKEDTKFLGQKTIRDIEKNIELFSRNSNENGVKKPMKSEKIVFSTQNKSKSNGDENEDNSIMSDLRYKSSYHLHNVNDATRENERDTERDKDALAILQRNMQISKDKLAGKVEPNLYKGSNANVIYLEKSEKDFSRHKVTGSLGPMRAPTNVRVTCRFDYAQGICKDYKETGRCGFGDGCVFMHDRGDYKTGWELEEEWNKEQKEKERLIREGKYKELNDEDEEYLIKNDEEEMELICPICEEDFREPIVTVCGHYFCEKCAIQNYERNPNCFVCRKKVNGIFNSAKDLIDKLKEKKERKQKEKIGPQFKPEANGKSDECCEKDECNHNSKCKKNKFEYNLDLNDEDEEEDDYEVIDEKSFAKASKNDNNLKNMKDKTKTKENKSDDKFEFDFGDLNKAKQKKNNFRIQNGWIYQSDFKNY